MANEPIQTTPSFRLIDPNDFTGVEGGDKFSTFVPLEDLNISVELTTTTKARSILTSTKEGGSERTTSGEISSITFIDGEKFGTKKYLTTNYTDFRDVTTNGDIEESLGITNIDIKFSSSYAPLVTISMIDVRGAAIFQNGATSKYSALFKMPYPIFNLKIKGYYGRPVQYCLHLTKVNSKFNSQTGNFEITADFIGYTYAMLTDILVGYLKALPFMERNKSKFKSLENDGIIGLHELIRRIGDINALAEGLTTTSDTAKDLIALATLKDQLNVIKNDIIGVIGQLRTDDLLPDNSNIVLKKHPVENVSSIIPVGVAANKSKDDTILDSYIKRIGTDVDTYNSTASETGDLVLIKDRFTKVTSIKNFSRIDLTNQTLDMQVKICNAYGYNVGDYGAISLKVQQLLDIIPVTVTGYVDFYDFTIPNAILQEKSNSIPVVEKELKGKVANDLRELVAAKLGFDPTIRNIFKILTAHIEIFLENIFDVSKQYQDSKRLAQLNKYKYSKRIDVKFDQDIYPWPQYNNESDQEEYIGSTGVVDNPLDIPEIAYVEELYARLIESAKKDEAQNQATAAPSAKQIWYGVNPLDTFLLNPSLKSPYKRVQNSGLPSDIASVVLIRALTFLGVSNRFLSNQEITAMAKVEAALLSKDLGASTNSAYQAFAHMTTYLVKSTTINETPIIKLSNDRWYYNLINPNSTEKAIPIGFGFDGKIDVNNKTPNNNTLTNLNASQQVSRSAKALDCGVYLRIFTNQEYINSAGIMDNPITQQESRINYKNLSVAVEPVDGNGNFRNIGFNPFSNSHGVQEFKLVNWGEPGLDAIEARFMFYSDRNKYANCLSGLRKGGSQEYDVTNNDIRVWESNKLGNTFRDVFYNDNVHPNIGKNKKLLTGSNVSLPFISFGINDDSIGGFGKAYYGLFGSRFYYEQSIKARAMLFLHSFPWNGLCEKGLTSIFNNDLILDGIFSQRDILSLFAFRAGFIQVPKLWPAFIGSLLWRIQSGQSSSGDPIIFKVGNEHLLPRCDNDTIYPSIFEFMSTKSGDGPLSFTNDDSSSNYKTIDKVLLFLPQQVKHEFIKAFETFVSTEWDKIRSTLEIINDGVSFKDQFNATLNEITVDQDSQGVKRLYVPSTGLKVRYKNFDQYVVFTPISDRGVNLVPGSNTNQYQMLLEFKENSTAMELLKGLFIDTAWIANTQWNIWSWYNSSQPELSVNLASIQSTTEYTQPSVSDIDLTQYLTIFMNELAATAPKTQSATQSVFTPNKENTILKLGLYRTIKAIYDKWVAGTTSPEGILFQGVNRLPSDTAQAKRRGATTPTLIDSFRFVSRSFQDLGDDFMINPSMIVKLLTQSNGNQSVYSFFSEILTQNNFDFVALPSFVNFNDPEAVKDIFKPYTYSEAVDAVVSGPSFVCVYVGQVSTQLDFDEDDKSYWRNDGMNLNNLEELASDFTIPRKAWEDTNAAFMVNYGHQNQSIFKDINLDQAEFSESDEGLQIINDIANLETHNDKAYAGQNLYNVWSVRSYKAQVEMMGDAMIQPMMYFQLNNVPMFHGAYLILDVHHNIKPNYMTTNFTGVRLKKVAPKLLDAAALYTRILGDYTPQAMIGSKLSSNVISYVPDYFNKINGTLSASTIVEGSTIPNKKAITQTAESEIIKWNNGKVKESDGDVMLDAYAKNRKTGKSLGPSSDEYETNKAPWSAAFISYIMSAGDPEFPSNASHYGYVTSALNNNLGYELFPIKGGLKIKAEVGDILITKRKGRYAASHGDLIYKVENNSAYLVGGNIGDSIKQSILDLTSTNGYITDQINAGTYQLLVKKTDNKYYHGKQFGNPTSAIQSTKALKKEYADNQKTVKTLLKAKGYSKEIVAGIMGNIQKESDGTFSPTISGKDINGYTSFGIIQWNTKSYSRTQVGSELEAQVNFIPKTNRFNTFYNIVTTTTVTPSTVAYLFAKHVEICKNCGSESSYNKDTEFKPADRSKFAEDFYNRFNDINDPLYWG